jgi:amidase
MSNVRDSVNAFTQVIPPIEQPNGPLKGLQFAVKDVFEIKSYRVQAGNPDYFAQAKVADETAMAVSLLQEAGAKLIAKTHTDELGGSLFGLNKHYGPPLNSQSPDRVPGGSSSGSAAAVSANLVDFALGADTSGSVRAPASFCGIYGLRPTFGKIPTRGVLPIAPSLDTVGIFAQHPQRIAQALDVYGIKDQSEFKRLRLIPNLIDSLSDLLSPLFLEKVKVIKDLTSSEALLLIHEDQLTQWSGVIRTIAMYDLWQVHKEWILKENPTFGDLISDRLKMARMIKDEDYQLARKKQLEIKEFMENSLEPGDIAVFPTVHDIPPLLSSPIPYLKDFALKTSRHTCIAALAGFPEITVPLKNIKGNCSLGMSLLGRAGCDRSLSSFSSTLHSRMQGRSE